MANTSSSPKGSFSDIAPDFDKLFADVNHLTNLEGDALARILRRHNARFVLDCACGTGVQSIGLARRHYNVSASDISLRMVRILREKAVNEGLSIVARKADFRDLRVWPKQEFDAVICSGNSLTLVSSRSEIARSLRSMYSCLKRPGVVIIGMHDYLKLKREKNSILLRRSVIDRGTYELLADVRNFGKNRVVVTNLFIQCQRGRWNMRTYKKSYMLLEVTDLVRLMKGAGFRDVQLLDISGQRRYNNDEWVLAVGTS